MNVLRGSAWLRLAVALATASSCAPPSRPFACTTDADCPWSVTADSCNSDFECPSGLPCVLGECGGGLVCIEGACAPNPGNAGDGEGEGE